MVAGLEPILVDARGAVSGAPSRGQEMVAGASASAAGKLSLMEEIGDTSLPEMSSVCFVAARGAAVDTPFSS